MAVHHLSRSGRIHIQWARANDALKRRFDLEAVDVALSFLVILATLADIVTTKINLDSGFVEAVYHSALLIEGASFWTWALYRLVGASVFLALLFGVYMLGKSTKLRPYSTAVLRILLVAAVVYSASLALANFITLSFLP